MAEEAEIKTYVYIKDPGSMLTIVEYGPTIKQKKTRVCSLFEASLRGIRFHIRDLPKRFLQDAELMLTIKEKVSDYLSEMTKDIITDIIEEESKE
jgi:hypothetical protein